MAGGDGSQALVAQVAMEHDLPYVCVPGGTRNHLALDLGLDRDDVVGALDAFASAVERRIDLAFVNDRIFVNNVSLGIYAEIVQSDAYRDAKLETVQKMLPELLGPRATPFDLRFQGPDGGDQRSAQLLLVSNNRYVLDRLGGIGSRPRMDTGKLGIVAVQIDDAAAAAKLVSLRRSQLHRFEGWLEWEATEFEVGSARGSQPASTERGLCSSRRSASGSLRPLCPCTCHLRRPASHPPRSGPGCRHRRSVSSGGSPPAGNSRNLRAAEADEGNREPEQRAGKHVGEPVHLQVRAAPRHRCDHKDGERPQASPSTRPAEEEHDRNRGRGRIRGVARGKRRAVCLDHLPRGTGSDDERLHEVADQRRERLGKGERDQCPPASCEQERETDREECECAQDTAAEGVEDERDVGQERRFDVTHPLRPVAVQREWPRRDDKRGQRHQNEQQAPSADRSAGMDEELLPAARQRPVSALRRPVFTASCSAS